MESGIVEATKEYIHGERDKRRVAVPVVFRVIDRVRLSLQLGLGDHFLHYTTRVLLELLGHDLKRGLLPLKRAYIGGILMCGNEVKGNRVVHAEALECGYPLALSSSRSSND